MSCRLIMSVFFTVLSIAVFGQVSISTNKQSCRFEVGERINFLITSNQTGNATYTLQYDRFNPIQTGSIFLQAGVTKTLSYTASEPTVINCLVNHNGNVGVSSAAVSPFQIQMVESAPSDFDSFWAGQKAQLAAVPINPNLNLHSNTAYSDTYRINLGQIDNRRIYGYITIPRGGGNYPAVITLPPYGNGANLTVVEPTFAEQSNTISMTISIHNVEPNQVDNNAYSPNYYLDKNQNYFRYGVLAGVRAIDYLYTRGDVDKSKIGLFGNSQGGGLSMLVAGIDSRVKVCMLTISALCMHEGYKYGRGSGFPYFLQAATGPAWPQEQTLQNVKYYDAVYGAARFKGPVLMSVSYLDDTTAPVSNFAAWNQFTGNNKILIHSTRLGHVSPSQMWQDRFKLLRRVWPNATANPLWPFGDTTSKGHWVNAGNNVNGQANSPVNLNGVVQYNEGTNFSWPVNWEKVSGPGNVNFSNANNRSTSATFSSNGTYILRFRAEDQQTYAGSNNFITMEDFVQVTIGGSGNNQQQNQTITFNSIPDKLTTDNPFNISASASSGLPITYSITSGPATISGNTISLTGQVGTVTVRANQFGNSSYFPASQQTRTFQVAAPNGGGNNGCTDSDNDGTCDADDCYIWNPNLPAAPGTPCNDYDPHNFNDVIQADGCTCQGTGSNSGGGNNGCTDSDNDGTCDADDCFIWNPNLPTAPGTPCDDYDPHNFNDVIQADGCTCQGTDSNSGSGNGSGTSDCQNPTLVSQGKSANQSSTLNVSSVNGNASKAVDGNTNGNYWSGSVSATTNSYQPYWQVDLGASYNIKQIKVWNRTEGSDRLSNFYVMISDTPFSSNLNTAINSSAWSQQTSGQAGTPSNYNMNNTGRYVRIQANGNSYLTLAEVQVYACTTGQSGNSGGGNTGCPDADNDGTCDADDCNPWNANLPATPGTPCNDYDPHNFNDVYLADGCTCQGTDSNSGGSTGGGNTGCSDSDNDGTCDSDDCNPWNPNLPATPGTPCNDYDPHNFNDVYLADGCTCQGTDSNTGGGGTSTCTSRGNSTSYEYIEKVKIGTINNLSGNNFGYKNYEYLSTDARLGEFLLVNLIPGFTGSTETLYWRIWIDYNNDGDFWDYQENFYQGVSNTSIFEFVNIPTNVNTGRVKLRVAMKAGSWPEACETFAFGEVEDYTINISRNGARITPEENVINKFDFTLRPNPVDDFVISEFINKENNQPITAVNLYNTLGEKIDIATLDYRIEEDKLILYTSSLNSGYYLLSIATKEQMVTKPFIKIK